MRVQKSELGLLYFEASKCSYTLSDLSKPGFLFPLLLVTCQANMYTDWHVHPAWEVNVSPDGTVLCAGQGGDTKVKAPSGISQRTEVCEYQQQWSEIPVTYS